MSNILIEEPVYVKQEPVCREYLFVNNTPEKSFRKVLLKRVFDLAFSLFVICLILSWLMPLLAIIIKLDSKGPFLFKQKRVGAKGILFTCYKFRTMYVNKEANVKQAEKNDPRITRLGKFLRVSCLDEFPQFINVFLGQMSVVGPRPHMLKDCMEFSKLIREYKSREHVKPGITGMAQAKGFRGKTVTHYDVIHRYKWDMFYVRNLSFRLDIHIILLTIRSTINVIGSLLIGRKNEEVREEGYQYNLTEYLN